MAKKEAERIREVRDEEAIITLCGTALHAIQLARVRLPIQDQSQEGPWGNLNNAEHCLKRVITHYTARRVV